jgi:hypothetical protein
MAKTVPFTFRIQIADKDSLVEFAKLYGSPSPGAFLNEMCHAILSGDSRKSADFLKRLLVKSGEQLALKLEAQVQAEAIKAQKKPKGRKLTAGALRNGKTS